MAFGESNPLGLESGVVRVVPYDPRWEVEFTAASEELHEALESSILAVHHVGSTAVRGLCARPILDLLVSVPDFEKSLKLVSPLEALGYEFRPDEEIPDRHYFRRRHGSSRTHHLSLAEPTSRYHSVTLAFCDALRADPAAARSYGDLKQNLACRYPRDREAYIAGKTAFVAEVLANAGHARGRAS